jgi:hypothetical protein
MDSGARGRRRSGTAAVANWKIAADGKERIAIVG